ncbi:hypothetical protein KR215_008167 [Drosophila sulfurigaster]|nr:hypothetical protein KR215_008167 [Drosophila sulfurigaster]
MKGFEKSSSVEHSASRVTKATLKLIGELIDTIFSSCSAWERYRLFPLFSLAAMHFLLLTTLLTLLEWGQVRSEDHYHSELPETLYAQPGCNATKMWIFQSSLMISKDDINKSKHFDEVVKLLPNTNSCEEDLRWNSDDIDKYVANRTYEDIRNFAKKYQSNFPQLLPKNYNNTYYKLAHTNYKHTEASLRAFTEGLFDKSTVPVSEDMEYLTELLRPCEQFKNIYTQDQKDLLELNDRIWKYFAERLKYPELTLEDFFKITKICSLQKVLNPNACNWCSHVEMPDSFKTGVEYIRLGYEYATFGHLNCRLMEDITSIFNSSESPNVVAYFTDLPIISMFNEWFQIEFHDKLVNVHNSFANNFVAVKYYCPAEADMEKEKIAFSYNMHFVQLKFCETRLCNWWDILEKFKNILEANCDDLYCNTEKPKQTNEELNLKENKTMGVVHNVSGAAETLVKGSENAAETFVKGSENAAETFVKGLENAAETFVKGAENALNTTKNKTNAGIS